ncbi:MAG: hypothetical protein HDQ87_05000 [Clostridia bacterium]|nr:hypothetical protein [Clostridia bacterium]
MKEMLKALAARSRLFSKCLALAVYAVGYQDIQQELETFVEPAKRTDRRYVRRLTLDILFSELHYQIAPSEYFWYRFEDKSDRERRTYIGDAEKNTLCAQMGDADSAAILGNKYACYKYFKEFYRRDVIRVSSQEDKVAFTDFFSRHRACIVKPIDQSGGTGIYRIDAESKNADECFQRILAGGPCVVEQCIEQSDQMARFHPQSVNTVRIATVRSSKRISIPFSVLKAGTGDAVVDNASTGGVFASIDVATGKVQSDGFLKNGSFCQVHPDSGCRFYGFQVPYWQELLNLAVKAAQTFPQYNYISWDFALTDRGWVMVEANSRGEFAAFQVFHGGIRELFTEEFQENEKYSEDETCCAGSTKLQNL